MDELLILKELGIPVAPSRIAKDRDDAVEAAERIGYPVVMKIWSRDIPSRENAGGVLLNLRSREEVEEGFKRIIDSAKTYRKDARIEGVLIQKYYEGGTEVVVRLMKDKFLGYILTFGLGGVFTRVLGDITYRVAPISAEEAIEMIKETEGYSILEGAEPQEHKDVKALAKTVSAFSRLGEKISFKEAEISPLLVFQRGVVAVDLKIRTK
jgi:acetyl-CoA synthetase (ADP-forming)